VCIMVKKLLRLDTLTLSFHLSSCSVFGQKSAAVLDIDQSYTPPTNATRDPSRPKTLPMNILSRGSTLPSQCTYQARIFPYYCEINFEDNTKGVWYYGWLRRENGDPKLLGLDGDIRDGNYVKIGSFVADPVGKGNCEGLAKELGIH